MPICIHQMNISKHFRKCAQVEWSIIHCNGICANVTMRRPGSIPWLCCHLPSALDKVKSTEAPLYYKQWNGYNFFFFQNSYKGSKFNLCKDTLKTTHKFVFRVDPLTDTKNKKSTIKPNCSLCTLFIYTASTHFKTNTSSK